ncbi:PX domain-containing protein 1 [Egretta garzetta]|nr:PX domain-containing protein 1 [Egretta garzetta]
MSPRETAVFFMCLCAVVDDSSQSATAEEEPERGLGPPLLPAAWAGSALLRCVRASKCAFVYAHDLFTLLLGLITIKEAHDIEARLNEVEKLLKTVINMPWKYSRSEVVLTFFERSPLDQVLKNDNVHKIQPSFQSPVKISEIMRSNGFCLANTETIVIDHSIPNGKEKHLDVDSAEHLFESVSEFTSELEDSDDPTAYVTNLTYYHLVPFETDILD